MKGLIALVVTAETVALAAWALSRHETVDIGGTPVNWKHYELVSNVRHAYDTRRALKVDWRYKPGRPLAENLAAPWPEKYQGHFEQTFNALAISKNVARVCRMADRAARGAAPFFRDLLAKIDAFSEVVDGRRYIVTRFDYTHHGVLLEAPWTSSITTAKVLAALSMMHECVGTPGALERAREIFNALADVRTKGNLDGFWTTFRDEDGFLWFEEYPMEEEQTHVLNGHISSLFSIYTYWQVTGDPQARKMLEAGLLTMERNVPEYRVPGKINDYDLRPGYVPDYGPLRTILQQKALYDISGEAKFLEYHEMFERDMGDEVDD